MGWKGYGKMEGLYQDVERNKYGFYELKNRASEEELASLYGDSYYQDEMSLYRKQYPDKELRNKDARLQRILHVIEKHMPPGGRERKLLDIGCGEGFALKFFLENGYDVAGIEYDTHGCGYHNPDVLDRVLQGDIYSVLDRFGCGSYSGTILMDNVLEHVLDPEGLIHKITVLSKPGTCLIVTVPNDFSGTQLRLLEKGCIRSPFWVTTASYPPEHLSYFNKDSLESLMEAYGWEMKYVMGSYPIDFNLFNGDTNYVESPDKGRGCYEAMLDIEELLQENSRGGVETIVEIYGKLGEAGLGRNITGFFTLR